MFIKIKSQLIFRSRDLPSLIINQCNCRLYSIRNRAGLKYNIIGSGISFIKYRCYRLAADRKALYVCTGIIVVRLRCSRLHIVCSCIDRNLSVTLCTAVCMSCLCLAAAVQEIFISYISAAGITRSNARSICCRIVSTISPTCY